VLAQAAVVLVLFAEPGFPAADAPSVMPALPDAVVAETVGALDSALALPGAVLVWRHGGTFPAEAWPVVHRFLRAGGRLLFLGGEPFTRPVTGPPGGRHIGPPTVSYLKALRLNRTYAIPVGRATMVFGPGLTPGRRAAPARATAWALEPRLSETMDFPDEEGSPGARDAVVRPVAWLARPGEDPRFPAAAAAIAIDWLRGAYAGGRWVLRLTDAPLERDELTMLLAEVARPATDFRVDPTFGTFHGGEIPSLALRVQRPGARDVRTFVVTVTVRDPAGRVRRLPPVRVAAGSHGYAELAVPGATRPGLYRVSAGAEGLPAASTGFWIFDPALFASGDSLSFDAYTLRRNGVPEPVVGTTVMSATVHRNFLFEPNAAVWDDTFAELASLGINLVRTGVWSGYRKIAPEPQVIDEAWLRALEAYYLTARRHGIPVVFTFFAFMPEAYGGTSPYFDPRALEGQRAYLAAVAARFAPAREILWDLINEPSFASPTKLWTTRPNGDPFEAAAFRAWLARTFAPVAGSGEDWTDVVRRRWRLTAGEPIGLPDDGDFADRNLFGTYRPYRARAYQRFAEDAFEDWVRTMRLALRQAGSTAPVTVGQDEGGISDRPGPLFHHAAVDFTSMHTWWNNDALLWDGVMARATGTPLLVSETGIMQRELLSGAALRDPDASARLLARKLAYAFAAEAFGAVEWVYDVNPYMNSDNEVAIGLRRVDGSYKPEHAVLRRFAAFVARNRRRFDLPAEPEAVLLVPSADQFSPRAMLETGTRRAVELLVDELGVPVRAVSEYRAARDLGTPRLIVVPAARGLAQEAWDAVMRAVAAGAVLQVSGDLEADDAGLPASRLGESARPLSTYEPLVLDGDTLILRFPLAAVQSAHAARGMTVTRRQMGGGAVLHVPVPLEWAERSDAQRRIYETGVEMAHLRAAPVRPAVRRPGVFVHAIAFRDATLVIVVNERASAERVALVTGDAARPVATVAVPAGDARLVLLDAAGTVVDGTDSPEAR
jgi:hypothetical protein